MIYTIDKNNKYANGERAVKQIFVNVTGCKKYTLDAGYVYSSNLCETHTLFLLISGSIHLKDESINAGHVVYISKFSSYVFTAVKASCVMEITFEYSDDIPLFDKALRIMEAPLEVQDYAHKIYSAKYFINSLPGIREGLLINLLNILNISCNTGTDELTIYKKCHEWIEQNADTYITAKDVSAAMNYSVAHLNRIVKKHSEKCLSTLIAEIRILKINQLIQNTNYSTKEIASKLGFESTELFRKYFKYHTGMSLNKYKADKK